jgi:hypothetical protein
MSWSTVKGDRAFPLSERPVRGPLPAAWRRRAPRTSAAVACVVVGGRVRVAYWVGTRTCSATVLPPLSCQKYMDPPVLLL